MHEASLVESLLGQVERLMAEHGASRVVSIRVSVGLLSGVEPELLGRAYQVLVEASPVRGAALVLEPVPITARCRDCRLESELASLTFECGGCGGHRLEVLRGEDLILESVTMEQEPLPGAEGVGTDRG